MAKKTAVKAAATKTEAPASINRVRRVSCKLIIDLKIESLIVLGKIIETEIKTHPEYGDSIRFKGDFEAVANIDGSDVTYSAKQFFAPSLLEEDLTSALNNADEGESVMFAVRISKTPSANSKTGYEWTYEPLTDSKPIDPLSEIRQLALA